MQIRTSFAVTALIALGSLHATHAEATTYYISKSGNDANPCTQASPCLTIGRGKTLAQPGDTVQVGPGTYNERLTLTTSGLSTGKITFRGHDGSGCPTTAVGDINSRGARPAPTVTMQGWSVDASFIAVECFRIAGTGSAGLDISANQSDIDFTDNLVDASATPGSPWAMVNMVQGVPVTSFPQNVYVARNYGVNTEYGILAFCRNCTFEKNEAERLMGGGAGTDHDYVRVFGEDLTFRGNYFHGNQKADCPGDCHIDCFQSWNIGQPGEVAQRITIDGNTCFHSDQKIIVRDVTGPDDTTPSGSHSDWTITNNIFAHATIGANASWCIDMEGVRNVSTYFNVCAEAGSTGYRYGTNASHANNINYGGTFNVMFAELGATMIARNNLCFDPDGTVNACPGTGSINNQDPEFVNYDANDFHIKSSSPAKDTGLAVGVNVDRAGNARPAGGNYDIGAYEFGASSTSRPSPPANLQVFVQ
jgi:hypothetical protein